WWGRRREALLKIAAERGEAYVYDLETVRAAAARLRALRSVDRVFYAVKANNAREVLRAVGEAGLNFECVSPGEIARVKEVFPGIDPRRILYTPNFAPRADYEYGLASGAWVTLDNLHPLRHWADLFADRDLVLRLDTGHGAGHHRHVRTAGEHSKFGIPLFELDEARRLADAAGARITGLHAHAGSGILTPGNWRDTGRQLVAAAEDLPGLKFLDLGGGLGIPEKAGEAPLDLVAVDDGLAEIREARPECELWLEPGRYVVAEAGVLLATVTQVKGKGRVRYVGVSTGMNSLIRPALYGAYHEIVNLSRLGEPGAHVVTVVGPNCETGDRLGTDRLLPECREG